MMFTEHAAAHPKLRFLVTAIGYGRGGWHPSQIASMFRKAALLPNVWLPQDFWDFLYA